MAAAGFKFRKIKSQPALGQKLFRVRKRRKATLEEAETATKIRIKYLEALENGDYRALPSEVYVKGFLQNYSQFLRLDFNLIYGEYQKERQSFGFSNDQAFLNRTNDKIDKPALVITSRTLLWPAIIISVMIIIGYVAFQVLGFASVPKLVLQTPDKDQIIYQNEQLFQGETDAGAALLINGQTVSVATDGRFNEMISLQKGLNTVEIKAENKNRKISKKVIIIEVREQTASK